MFSRRAFLIGGAGVAWASDPPKNIVLPSEAKRYSDGVTEFQVLRLTAPDHTAALTAYFNRCVAGRAFLLYASDRGGKMDVYRLDLKSFENRKLTDGDAIRPETIDLLPGDRNFIVADGKTLWLLPANGGRQREMYTGSGEIVAASASEDGTQAAVIESRYDVPPDACSMGKGSPRVLVEADERLSDPVHRRQRASILFRRGQNAIWLANYDGQQTYRLRLPAGSIADPQWAPDGRSLLYLLVPDDPGQRGQIHEFTPDTNEDKLVAPTSRFVRFSANADAAVFVGSSASKAAPHVLLLLRSVKRELTICEHRASDPAAVAPVFSPNSQRVFFVSDQHGKPAIYTMSVERLVEET